MCRGWTGPPIPGQRSGNPKDATSKNTYSQMNHYLKDDLRAGMELLKDTHAEAYKALREASQVDDARYGKAGRVAGAPTGDPIRPR